MRDKILKALLCAVLVAIFAAGCTVTEDQPTTEPSTKEQVTSTTAEATEITTTEPATEPVTTEPATEPTTVPTTVSQEDTQPAASNRKIIDLSAVPWYLVLANGDYQLPDGFTVDDVNIMGHGYGEKYKYSLDSRIADIWNEMYLQAQSEGYNIAVNSSFRLISDQKILFERQVKKYTDQGYSRADAEVLAAKSVMYPGCSDHNLGLAVDVLTIYTNGESAKEFGWLMENAEDYGFVLRYPKDKVDITKVKYEPWHWRYVGVEAAKEMNELNMCLEEYHVYKGIVQ